MQSFSSGVYELLIMNLFENNVVLIWEILMTVLNFKAGKCCMNVELHKFIKLKIVSWCLLLFNTFDIQVILHYC